MFPCTFLDITKALYNDEFSNVFTETCSPATSRKISSISCY